MSALFAVLLRKEVRALLSDGRLVVLLLLWCVLSLTTAVVASLQQQREAAERARVSALTRAQWDQQGDKHPHRGAHFGLYALREVSMMAAFDPGVTAAVGQALYLEPHRRNVPMFSGRVDEPSSARLVRLSPAWLVELLLPLIVYVLAFASVTGERESGTLRMLHAAGLPRLGWLFAKVLSVAACVVLAALPSLAVPGLLEARVATSGDLWRALLMASSVVAVALLHAALAVGVSCGCRNSRVSLLLLLALWVAMALVLPRFAAQQAVQRVPLPEAAGFWSAINREIKDGLPGEANAAERMKAFERQTLQAHGVSRAEDLPVGYLALRRLHRDAYADRVHDRHFSGLWATYLQQQRVLLMASGPSPTVAWREVSMALAGTDLAQERHFQEAAERYRRDVNTAIDRWDAAHSHGVGSYEARYAGAGLWQAIPRFEHRAAGVSAALSNAALPLRVLGGWGVVALALLFLSSRRLAP